MGALAAVSVGLLYSYDMWYSGEDEISLGDEQLFYIWMALIATIVLFALGGTLLAMGRGKRKKAKKAAAVGGVAVAGAAAVAIAADEEEPAYEEPGPEPYPEETYADEDDLVYECPECGSPVAEDAMSCDTCGVRFAAEEDEDEVVADDEISISVGKDYPPDAGDEEMPAYEIPVSDDKSELYAPEEEKKKVELDFGDDIDADLADDDEEFVYECPECGGDVAEDDVICPHCGAEFED
jgi:rubrerythrin